MLVSDPSLGIGEHPLQKCTYGQFLQMQECGASLRHRLGCSQWKTSGKTINKQNLSPSQKSFSNESRSQI